MNWEEPYDVTPRVRRLSVPGGWLYQVEDRLVVMPIYGQPGGTVELAWGPPVFVSNGT